MTVTKSYATVDAGVIQDEWRNKRRPFEVGGTNYYPGEQADDAWFQSQDVFIGTITSVPYDSATQVRTSALVIDEPSKTYTRTDSVRAKTAQELDDDLENQYAREMTNSKIIKAVVFSINDGTLVPGDNVSNAALKAIIKANM